MINAICIDIVLVLIVVFIIWRAARKGFVRSLIELVGYVVAAIIAFTAGEMISDTVCQNYVSPAIVSVVSENIKDGSETTASDVFGALPEYVKNVAKLANITEDTVQDKLTSSLSNTADDIAKAISDLIIPVVKSAIKLCVSLILFVLLMIVVRFLAIAVNKIFDVPLLRTLNQTLGALLGVIRALLTVCILVLIVRLCMNISGNEFLIFNNETIDSTFIFKFFYNFNI